MTNHTASKLTELGKALRAYRLKLSLTQRSLSQSLGWAPSRMKSIEFGSRVTDKELMQLAGAFHLDAVPPLWHDLRKLSNQVPQLSRHLGCAERLSPFGKFLRDTRTALGVTQDLLAKALGIRNGALVRLEYGQTKNPQKLAIRVLFGLGFPADLSEQITRTFDENGDWPESAPADARPALIQQWYRSNAFADTLTAETQADRPSRLTKVLQRINEAANSKNLSPLPPFGTELRRLRIERGIAPDVFCKKIKFSAMKLAQLEQGLLPVDRKLLKSLAKALDLPSVPETWPPLVTNSHQDPDYESPFGQLIQMVLRARRMSHTHFASHISLTPPTLKRLIRGAAPLTQSRLNLILETLELPATVEKEVRSVVDAQGQFADPQTKARLPENEVGTLLQNWLQTVRSQTPLSS